MTQHNYVTSPTKDSPSWQDLITWDEELFDPIFDSDTIFAGLQGESLESEQPYLVSAPPSLTDDLSSPDYSVSAPPSILGGSSSFGQVYCTSPSLDTTTASPLVGHVDGHNFGSLGTCDSAASPLAYPHEYPILDTRYELIEDSLTSASSFETTAETVFNPHVAGPSHSFSGLDVRASQVFANVGTWTDQPQIIEPISEADEHNTDVGPITIPSSTSHSFNDASTYFTRSEELDQHSRSRAVTIPQSNRRPASYNAAVAQSHWTSRVPPVLSVSPVAHHRPRSATLCRSNSRTGSRRGVAVPSPSPTSEGFGWVSYHMNSQTKRLTPTSTEGIQGRTPRGRKKGLSAEQRHNAALMRVIGACSNCQRRKEKCDPGTPCRSCLEHYKGDLVNHPCRDRVLSDKSASFLSDKLGWHPSARSLESFVTPNSFNLVPDITYNIPLYFGFGDPLSLPVHALNVDEPQAHLHEHIIYAWPPESSTGSKHTHAALPALLTRDGMSGLMETLDNHLSLLVSHHFRQFPLFCSPLRILREVYIFYLSRPSHYRTLHQALKLLVLVHIGGDITLPPPKDNPVLSQLVQNTNVPNDLTPTPCFIRSQFGRVMPGLALSLMKEVLSSLELLLLNRECDDWPMALAVLITVLMTVESIHYHAAKLPYHNSFDSPEFSTSDENHGIDEEGVNTLLAFYSSCFAGCHARLRPDWEGETKAMSPTQRNSLSPDNLFIESVRGSIKRASDGGIISCKATEKRKGDDMEFFFDRLVARLLLMKPASVFSVQSLASSATDLSKGSIYSANQIVTATRELVDILQGDEALIPFYKSAIEDPSIGPERLQRNLGRLVKQYAENLKSEAKESLEYLAARLVSMKAKFVARSIVQTFAEGSTKHVYEKAQEKKGESSEDDVDEDVFEDIIIFREFLVHSDALKTLRAQVQSFVLPKGAHSSTEQALIEEVCGCEGYSEAPVQQNVRFGPTRGIFSRLGERLNALLVAVGCREPPLEPGRIRLRWQCGCGEQFTSDVTEHRQGGVADLVARMQRSTGARIVATPYNSRSTNQKYKFYSPIKAIGGGFTRLSNAFRKPSKQCTLPRHNNTTTASTTPGTTPPQQKLLHLLSCMHAGRFRKSLYQDRIEDITTDHGLFCFLRKQFIRYRGRFCTLLSLKTVKSLKFIKFRLPRGGSVEVRQHDPSQPLSCCDCLPPPDRVEPALQAEYKCKPGPPDIWPPIDPEYLAHLMISPCYIDKKDDWILDMLPRRICGVLEHNTGQPVEGWGIYFEEDWDRNIITLVVFITFLTTSLVFGILWYKLKMDMQGAFGVCAYMMAACAVIISMVTMWVDRV